MTAEEIACYIVEHEGRCYEASASSGVFDCLVEDCPLEVECDKKRLAIATAYLANLRPVPTQPAPTPNDNQHIADLVMADILKRKQRGIETYGTPLQAHNGRDALQDAYEEALDMCCYLRQAIEERR